MGVNTNISWCDCTANGAFGCRKVDRGCDFCYMFRILINQGRDPNKLHYFSTENLKRKIKSWPSNKCLCFFNDMTDTFHEDHPIDIIEAWHELFESLPEREFLILTKRIGTAERYYRTHSIPDNVWIGCSIGEKKRLFRIDTLKKINAKIRFISFEPLIEDLVPESGFLDLKGIQWAIVGGESGYQNEVRPMDPHWAIKIRRNCYRDRVAFFFKQQGGVGGDGAGGEILQGFKYHEWPTPRFGTIPSNSEKMNLK